MKKKEAIELFKKTAERLVSVSPASMALCSDGSRVPVAAQAHGAGTALAIAALLLDDDESEHDVESLISSIIMATVEWEHDHPELMGGGDHE